MRKSVVGIMVLIVLVVTGGLLSGAGAPERERPFRIGALTTSWGPTPMIVGLRDGLLELGHHEDKDFVLGVRFTQGDITALPAAAQELVQYGVDLIFAESADAVLAAQQATGRIPIVFANVGNPTGLGLVESLGSHDSAGDPLPSDQGDSVRYGDTARRPILT